MDPNATLDEILALARRLDATDGEVVRGYVARELAENVLALDKWITKGGFLPARWRGDAANR